MAQQDTTCCAPPICLFREPIRCSKRADTSVRPYERRTDRVSIDSPEKKPSFSRRGVPRPAMAGTDAHARADRRKEDARPAADAAHGGLTTARHPQTAFW